VSNEFIEFRKNELTGQSAPAFGGQCPQLTEDEIEKEETDFLAIHKGGPIGTNIKLKNNTLQFEIYSDKLVEKMKGCFTEDDNLVLADRLQNALSFLN